MSIFCDDDDDVMVIALWIIAIGFIILAIDKTTKLNNAPNSASNGNGSETILPPTDVPLSQTQSKGTMSATQLEDQQFYEIQKQLRQLGTGLSALRKNMSNTP